MATAKKTTKTAAKAAPKTAKKAAPKKAPKSLVDEICGNLKKAGFLAIPVQTLNEEAEASRYFEGDFKEFVAAAKSLGAKSIFVDTLYLEEEEFFYDCGYDPEEFDDEEEEECTCKAEGKECKCVADYTLYPEDLNGLDLSLLRPEIAKYEKYLGEPCGVRLTVPGADHLEVEIFAEWYDDFAELVDDASCEIEEDPEEALKIIEKNSDEINNQ